MTDQHTSALARSISARVHAMAERGCADELRVLDYLLVRLELGEQQYGRLDLAADLSEAVMALERQRWNEGQGDDREQGYRLGWNERSRTLLELMRGR